MLPEEKLSSDDRRFQSSLESEDPPGSVTISDELDDLEQELSEVRELARIEKTLTQEVIGALKPLLRQLSTGFEIRASLFPKLEPVVSRMVLMPDGVIILEVAEGKVRTRPLEDLSAESLVKILGEILPSMLKIVSEERSEAFERKDALEVVVSRLRRVNFDF